MTEQGGTQPEEQQQDEFVPRGAMAFMVFMVLAYAGIWFFFYALILGRS